MFCICVLLVTLYCVLYLIFGKIEKLMEVNCHLFLFRYMKFEILFAKLYIPKFFLHDNEIENV